MAEPSSTAVIAFSGRQYRVRVGDSILVDRLPAAIGDSAALGKVLSVETAAGDIIVGKSLADAAVSATVAEHLRGKKIRVFKMRRRKSSRRANGHRQDLTRVTVNSIQH